MLPILWIVNLRFQLCPQELRQDPEALLFTWSYPVWGLERSKSPISFPLTISNPPTASPSAMEAVIAQATFIGFKAKIFSISQREIQPLPVLWKQATANNHFAELPGR